MVKAKIMNLLRYLYVCSVIFVLVTMRGIPVSAGSFDTSILRSSIGINIHQISNEADELAQMWDAGIRIVRLDLTWQSIENRVGLYQFEHYDHLAHVLSEKGFRILFILAYSNKLYEPQINVVENGMGMLKTIPPISRKASMAFERFVRAAVTRYQKFNPIWEIWNEPDFGFWPPEPNVFDYEALANATCHEIRAVDATATVVAPGAAKTPRWMRPVPEFLSTLLRSNLVRCLDAVSVHPYLNIGDLDWTPSFWSALRQMASINASATVASSTNTFISSEWGLSTSRDGITDETQASYLAKMLMYNAMDSIGVSIIYDWRDDGNDPKNPEHRFGIVRHDGSAKPAYKAIKQVAAELGDAKPACRLDWPHSIGLVFVQPADNQVKVALWPKQGLFEWSAKATDVARFDVNATVSTAVDLIGAPVDVKVMGDTTIIGPGLPPFYLRLMPTEHVDAVCQKAVQMLTRY